METKDHISAEIPCEDEQLSALLSELAVDVPDGLNASIMQRIRLEKRALARRRMIRRLSAVAAAVVLVPVICAVAPILLRSSTQAMSLEDADSVVCGVDTEGFTHSYAETTGTATTDASSDVVSEDGKPVAEEDRLLPDESTDAPIENNVMIAAPKKESAPETTTAPATLPSAPSYVGAKEAYETSEKTVTTMSRDSVASPMESALSRVLRVIVGDEAFDNYADIYSGDENALTAALCRDYHIARETIEEQADALKLEITDAELDALFED